MACTRTCACIHTVEDTCLRLVKQCGMFGAPAGLTNSNIVHTYFAANFEEDAVNNWEDWDYDMEREEFYEALCRVGVAAVRPSLLETSPLNLAYEPFLYRSSSSQSVAADGLNLLNQPPLCVAGGAATSREGQVCRAAKEG